MNGLRLWMLLALMIVLLLLDLMSGTVRIPLSGMLSGELSESYRIILNELRLPRVITAICAGSGLSVSGLLMQTFFRNPIAGPYILGVSSGASLGVALVMLGAGVLGISFTGIGGLSLIVLAAISGAMLVLLLALLVAGRLGDLMSLLIIGLLFAGFTSAVVGILQYYSDKDSLQAFVKWTFGSLMDTRWEQLAYLIPITVVGLLGSLALAKPLNALLLGETYASSLGVNVFRQRRLIILICGLLAGAVTAWCGPIAFVGIAVPHLARMLFRSTNHFLLIPAVAILGACVLLACDLLSRAPYWLPFLPDLILPINAVTSLFGAPLVIWIIWRNRKLQHYF